MAQERFENAKKRHQEAEERNQVVKKQQCLMTLLMEVDELENTTKATIETTKNIENELNKYNVESEYFVKLQKHKEVNNINSING